MVACPIYVLEHCLKSIANSAVIAQWIRMCLPSCVPGFESQAQHPRFAFFNLNLNSNVKRTKINEERPKIANMKKTQKVIFEDGMPFLLSLIKLK